MERYRHTQIGYLMIVVTMLALAAFAAAWFSARAEPPSVDSGTNLAMTALMALILILLASLSTLTVMVDEKAVRIRFGWGIFRKSFLLSEIATARKVRNSWYYGWGIRLWLWPYMWIFNISGFDAIELRMKNGRIYRIGTDEPDQLEAAVRQAIGA